MNEESRMKKDITNIIFLDTVYKTTYVLPIPIFTFYSVKICIVR